MLSYEITRRSIAKFALKACAQTSIDRSLETLTERVGDGTLGRVANKVGCWVVSSYITSKVGEYVDKAVDEFADKIVEIKLSFDKEREAKASPAPSEEVINNVKESMKDILNDANKENEEAVDAKAGSEEE